MSLLQQTNTEIDDAALGEDYTKGSTHLIWAAGIATVIVSIGIGLYFILGQKPPAVTGEIMQVWVEPLHTQTSGIDASGAAVPVQQIDQVLVFAQVRLHNQGKEPLVLHQILTNTVLGDATISNYAAIPADYDRLFEVYPQLTSPHGASIASRQTIAPGQSVEGEFVSAFHMTKADWDKHKGLDFTFVFDYQPFLKLAPKSPVP
jgi:hypothetical protein